MRKVLTLITLLFIAFFTCYGQQDAGIPGQSQPSRSSKASSGDHRVFLSVGAGPALAMGEFASQDASDIEAGFAKSGLGLTVNAGYRFINNIGVTASFLYGSHNLYPYDINGTDISNDASPWTYTSFLAGLWVTSHSKPFSVDGRIMAGFANATSSDYGGYLLQESAGGFALMAGAGVKYQIGSVLILTANADFFSTKVSFTDNGFDQPIGTIMITGGLGILLF